MDYMKRLRMLLMCETLATNFYARRMYGMADLMERCARVLEE